MTPVQVTAHAATVAVPTKTAVGTVRRSVRLTAAATALTPAHRYVRRLNSRTIAGLAWTSSLSGQKSLANRVMSGRPIATETPKVAAVTTVRRIGCTKYTNELPLSR